jgi:hypothetical protein
MGALYVDVSENALGDEGAAAVARELTNDAWLKGRSGRRCCCE